MEISAIVAIIIVTAIVITASVLLVFFTRYKKCPSDKVMVIYGKISGNKNGSARSAKCIHGGAAFIVPMIQSYAFLDLTPISIDIDLINAPSKQNIGINVSARFTVGISVEPSIMLVAAEQLLGKNHNEIKELAKDVIIRQARMVVSTMSIEEIYPENRAFTEKVLRCVEGTLEKIGLRLINISVTDISDDAGIILRLQKEEAAKAVNDAKINFAEAEFIKDSGNKN